MDIAIDKTSVLFNNQNLGTILNKLTILNWSKFLPSASKGKARKQKGCSLLPEGGALLSNP